MIEEVGKLYKKLPLQKKLVHLRYSALDPNNNYDSSTKEKEKNNPQQKQTWTNQKSVITQLSQDRGSGIG